MTYPGQLAPEHSAFDKNDLLRDLESRLDAVQDEAFRAPAGTVVSLVLNTPELICAGAHTVRQGDFYWSRPAKQELRISTGVTWTLTAEGRHRLAHLDRALHGIGHRWNTCSPDGIHATPAVWAGFAFDPADTMQGDWQGLPNAMLQVPELSLTRSGTECHLTLSTRIGQRAEARMVRHNWRKHLRQLLDRFDLTGAETGHAGNALKLGFADHDNQQRLWAERVCRALDGISNKQLEKLVLTRRLEVRASRDMELTRVLAHLETKYPDCIQYSVPVGHRTLVGATPERLVCVDRGTAVVDAIAGTEPHGKRDAGEPGVDLELIDSRKARHEHQLVVTAISNALGPISSEIIIPDHPHLMTLPNVHHLWSPIRARLLPGTTLLAAADRLHPTPAVGGTPRHAASDWLRSHGENHRGWYTGGYGWLTPDGEGELAVILRCGLLDRRGAVLFAGAGIVGGSEISQEFQETEWKLQSMIGALASA